MTIEQVLPFLIPILLLEVVLIVAALYDLTRPERKVRGDSKLMWGIVIVLLNLIGPILYFLVGREDEG